MDQLLPRNILETRIYFFVDDDRSVFFPELMSDQVVVDTLKKGHDWLRHSLKTIVT